jgi:metal-responsive CopG/Arc/MetJ family transcriptional regulator
MAKVMISLPQELLKEIDLAAKREHRSRSELIRETVRLYLAESSQLTSRKSLSRNKGFLWVTVPHDEESVH